jgi:hypothetical protein
LFYFKVHENFINILLLKHIICFTQVVIYKNGSDQINNSLLLKYPDSFCLPFYKIMPPSNVCPCSCSELTVLVYFSFDLRDFQINKVVCIVMTDILNNFPLYLYLAWNKKQCLNIYINIISFRLETILSTERRRRRRQTHKIIYDHGRIETSENLRTSLVLVFVVLILLNPGFRLDDSWLWKLRLQDHVVPS